MKAKFYMPDRSTSSPSSPLKVGLVGARRGEAYVAGFNAAPETEIVAVCDSNAEMLSWFGCNHDVPHRYIHYGALLSSDVDIVVVAAPMPLHVPMAVAALEAGKHVLSEVPAATDLRQCWQLVQAVRRSPAVYMMAENVCYMKANVLVGELARHGLFGQLYYAEGEYTHELKALNEATPWRRVWQTGRRGCTYATHSLGPPLQWFNAAHRANMARIKVQTIACFGSGHHYKDWRGEPFENDDVNLMVCGLSNGGMLKVRVDMLSERPANANYFSLQGPQGCFESSHGFGDEPRIWLKGRHDPGQWHSLWDFEAEFMPEMWRDPSDEARHAWHHGISHGGSDYFQVRAFIDSIVHGTPPPIDVYAALDMTVPGLISEESINRGGAVLPVPDFREIEDFARDLPPELRRSKIIEADLPLTL
jgi:predicted dehydrogenase